MKAMLGKGRFKMKIAESYSVIVIPKDRAKVRRWVVSRERIVGSLVLVLGLTVFIAALSLGFLHYQRAYFATEELRHRGEQYEKERLQVLARLEDLESLVNQNEDLVSKLETIVGVHPVASAKKGIDSLKLVSLDPKETPSLSNSNADFFDETTLRSYNLRSIDLIEEVKEVGGRLKEVYNFSGQAEYFWTAVPTIAPVRGWITSDFGVRRSPLTGHRQLHEGIDIASPYGAAVMASGDGVVVSAGRYGGLGKKLIVDHGYGLATVYGHNSEVLVKEGEHVRRGQTIARVGSTGRSTGPHLHYEVLLHGIPVDPRQFMLEQL